MISTQIESHLQEACQRWRKSLITLYQNKRDLVALWGDDK